MKRSAPSGIGPEASALGHRRWSHLKRHRSQGRRDLSGGHRLQTTSTFGRSKAQEPGQEGSMTYTVLHHTPPSRQSPTLCHRTYVRGLIYKQTTGPVPMTNLNGNTRTRAPHFDKQANAITRPSQEQEPSTIHANARHRRPPKRPSASCGHPILIPSHLPGTNSPLAYPLRRRCQPASKVPSSPSKSNFRSFNSARTERSIHRHAPQTSHLVCASRSRHSTHAHTYISPMRRATSTFAEDGVAIILELRKHEGTSQ
ncbi:hypothetical protein K456DRAFT_1757024 [Colletotrichum gloeosporioides 23]|nr:hypothetical protein K456DRAFT_1757024 [Colletotrichum gloeosporioides 23]